MGRATFAIRLFPARQLQDRDIYARSMARIDHLFREQQSKISWRRTTCFLCNSSKNSRRVWTSSKTSPCYAQLVIECFIMGHQMTRKRPLSDFIESMPNYSTVVGLVYRLIVFSSSITENYRRSESLAAVLLF